MRVIFTYQSSAYWGGGAGGRILDKERERETERERVMHQYIVYTCICDLYMSCKNVAYAIFSRNAFYYAFL